MAQHHPTPSDCNHIGRTPHFITTRWVGGSVGSACLSLCLFFCPSNSSSPRLLRSLSLVNIRLLPLLWFSLTGSRQQPISHGPSLNSFFVCFGSLHHSLRYKNWVSRSRLLIDWIVRICSQTNLLLAHVLVRYPWISSLLLIWFLILQLDSAPFSFCATSNGIGFHPSLGSHPVFVISWNKQTATSTLQFWPPLE